MTAMYGAVAVLYLMAFAAMPGRTAEPRENQNSLTGL